MQKSNIRLLSKLALLEKISYYWIIFSENFERICKHRIEKFYEQVTKKSYFSKQMEFRKKSIRIIGLLVILSLIFSTFLYATENIKTVFDIGTGKIKMQIVEIDSLYNIKTLYSRAEKICPDGQLFVNSEGYITINEFENLKKILNELLNDAKQYNSKLSLGFATEAFRKARNGEEILKNLSKETGIEINQITQEEEGILGFWTAVKEANLDSNVVVVWDIGTGSFQITCKKDSDSEFVVYQSSFGRSVTYELMLNQDMQSLENSLLNIQDFIKDKICKNGYILHGVGAHPKTILNSKNIYTQKDVSILLNDPSIVGIDRSDLLLVEMVMKVLSVEKVVYHKCIAGNTTGYLLKLRIE